MAQQDIIIGDSGTVAKDKINGNFDELYAIELKCEWYEEITSGTAGTLVPPTGATILLNEWADGVDALASKSAGAGDLPTFETPVTSGGTAITATLATNGDWTLSGTPSIYPVCIIYVYKVAAVSYDDTKSLVTTTIGGSGGGAIDWENPIAINTATALTIGRHHVISDLGSPADYTVTLPAVSGNAGKLISWEIALDVTKMITVKVPEETTLTGTVSAGIGVDKKGTGSVSSGGTAVTGVGTSFTTELNVGDSIWFGVANARRTVASITNDTALVIDSSLTAAGTTGWYYDSVGVVGVGTDFDPEVTVGDCIRVGSEYREVVARSTDTNLIIDRPFGVAPSGSTSYSIGSSIDGYGARVQWENETAILSCDGTNWTKVAGKSIPMNFSAYSIVDQLGLVSATTVVLECGSTKHNRGGAWDTTNFRLTPRRDGEWQVSARSTRSCTSSAEFFSRVNITANINEAVAVVGFDLNFTTNALDDANNRISMVSSFDLLAADYLDIRCYSVVSASTWKLLATQAYFQSITGEEIIEW